MFEIRYPTKFVIEPKKTKPVTDVTDFDSLSYLL